MPKPIIQVKKISKKYRIGHQERYLALRDVIANCFKKPWQIFTKASNHVSNEDFWALKDIDFDVQQGEVVGVIGRNGAGKTTLLKILSRITYPSKGEIRLLGRVGSLLEVGTGFHPELTGRENIYFNGAILGMRKKEIERKFDEIVDFSGVEKFLDTPVKRFSSGMKVRLAFSVAAHLDPEILLIDEVLAVGDAQFQKKCLGKMQNVSKSGRTILFVSHNMSAVRNLCKRTILLDQGNKIMDTDTETVIPKYLDQNLQQGAKVSENEFAGKIEGLVNRYNPTIRFKEVFLADEHGIVRNRFRSDERIIVGVTYECLTVVGDIRVVIQVVDEDNRPVLISQNTDEEDEISLHLRQPGIYKSKVVIPPDTFGDNHLYISLHLIYPKTEHLIVNKILGFDIDFQPYNNVQYAQFSKAFLRPKLPWKTQLQK
ncbi:MAG: polysaccharide ABC transporter ATP-binding protein [Candidatus Omnitrophota bacterium]